MRLARQSLKSSPSVVAARKRELISLLGVVERKMGFTQVLH